MIWPKLTKLQILVHVTSLVPLALLIWDAFHNNLTANPIQDITFRTGTPALVLLVLSLACTPLNTLFRFREALRVRRALGLYAFMYVILHFFTFVGLDYGFDPDLLKEAIFEKRYALVGFSAFLLLLPLAITSTKGWMKRLGKNWKQLHRLVYLAAPLAVIHYIWLVKTDIRTPLAFGAAVLLLLTLRLPRIRHWASETARPALQRLVRSPQGREALEGKENRI
ncbi:MAG: sulfoxide reductase heme-binding subunit YedZ [Chloroflexi bacterium]|nr:sulfoxide reductase heme-binding subunit YedZ [Chloroflexota bacterium]